MPDRLLEIKNLKTSFFTHSGEVQAVRGISFDIYNKESVGIVGESGSGKSVTALSIMRLLQDPGKIIEGEINFLSDNLAEKAEKEMNIIRGSKIAMVFQDSMTSLNPVLTVGNQLIEAILQSDKTGKKQAKKRAVELLKLVNLAYPEKIMSCYPHQLSGGMRQRVMIAMAIAGDPLLLIADEPTTSLDVTIQAQILNLMKDIKNKSNTAILLISHNIGVIAEICEKIIVMYGGLIMEKGLTQDIIKNPKHPYTQGLLKSIPQIEMDYNGKQLFSIGGMPPDLFDPPMGCPFMSRCQYAMKVCKQRPPYFQIKEEHFSMCWLLHEAAPYMDWNKIMAKERSV